MSKPKVGTCEQCKAPKVELCLGGLCLGCLLQSLTNRP